MTRTFLIASLALTAVPAAASDPIGIYALIEKVTVLEDTVEIEGAFATASGRRGAFYRAPQWSTLRFRLAAGNEEQCRKEWADLARVAGTGEVVGFGARRQVVKDETPAPYPLGWGVQRLKRADYGPARMLRNFPRPVGPARVEAAKWGQTLELRARNAHDAGATRYLFEVRSPRLGVMASPPIAAGEKTTAWKVHVVLGKGETVTWSVRVLRDDLEQAAVATATIEVA